MAGAKFEVDVGAGTGGALHVSPGTGVFAFVGHADAGVLALYDCKSGEHMVRHETKDDTPTAVATAHDSSKAAYGTRSGSVWVWDVGFPAVLECFKAGEEGDADDPIDSLRWHPRGHALAVAHASGRTTVWDMCLGAPAWTAVKGDGSGGGGEVSHIGESQCPAPAWTANGRALVVARGSDIEVWDSRRGARTKVVENSNDAATITALDAMEDMSRVALVGRADGTAELCVLKVGEEDVGVFAELPKHEGSVIDARIAPLSTVPPMRCATVGSNQVLVFDMQSKEGCGRWTHDEVHSISFAADGKTLFSAGGTCVRAWDARGGDCESVDIPSPVSSFVLADSDTSFIVGCEDGILRCYDVRYPARTLGDVN